MIYTYKRTEPGLWTVGYQDGDEWVPDSDYPSPDEAAARIHYLNGGASDFAELHEMPATAMTAEQQIRLALTTQILKWDWDVIEGHEPEFAAEVAATVDPLAAYVATGAANGDSRNTAERNDERAKWTKDLAEIFRGMAASADYAAYMKAADFLDPPKRSAEPLPPQDGDGAADVEARLHASGVGAEVDAFLADPASGEVRTRPDERG